MEEKIRILEVVKCLDIGGIGGGAERFGIDLAISLAQKGAYVNVCAFYKTFTQMEQLWIDRLNEIGIGVFFLVEWKGYHDLLEFFQGVGRFRTLSLKLGPNIIHSHSQFGTIAAIYSSLPKRSFKIVRTAHVTQEWGKSIYSRLQKLVWGEIVFPFFLDAQVAVSKAVQKSVEKYIGNQLRRKKIWIIHNSISIPKDSILNKFDEKKKSCEFIVGTVARLTEQKGINYLIEAAEIVSQQNPHIKFLIAGEGELKDKLMNQINNSGLSERVVLIGQHSNIYQFLSKIDLFVLPSLWEGLPTVILEAMAAGVPVIATDIPGTDELIEDGVNGWLVQPKNSIELANKIMEAINLPHIRRKYVLESKQRLSRFSMDKIANQYLVLFFDLLGKK